MAYRDIVVFLDSSTDMEERVEAAIALAALHGARLLGVDITPKSALEAQGAAGDRARGVPDNYRELTRHAPVRADYAVAEAERESWRDFYSHYADLVVASARTPENSGLSPAAIPEAVLLSAGVPCLILPALWKKTPLGRNVVIAWTASREATRAVHDAMPLLERASSVTLFCADARSDGARSDPELMRAHLAHHGVHAGIDTWISTPDVSPVTALFACLETQDADLIVAGAYSHSKLMEGLFGGATKEFLKEPTLPLLMSH